MTYFSWLQGYSLLPPLAYIRAFDNHSQQATISERHYREWIESAVDPAIIALNVESLEGDDALERLTENAIEAIGKDQKVPHSFQYVTSPVAKILNRYKDMSSEGWWASGIDILSGEPSQWGCYKPDKPRLVESRHSGAARE